MNLTGGAIKLNRLTYLVAIILIIGGPRSYLTLGQQEDPAFSIKTAIVTCYLPGATTEDVERQVADVLETNIQQLLQLDYLETQVRPGFCRIEVNILAPYWSDRLPQVWDELRRKVNQAVPELPPEVVGPFVNDDFGQVFGIVLGVAGDGFNLREIREHAEILRDRILAVPGVGKVLYLGVQEEEILLEATSSRLASSGLSEQSFDVLRAQNRMVDAGNLELDQAHPPVFASGLFEDVEDIRNAEVPTRQGGIVRLDDVLDVRRAFETPPHQIMLHGIAGQDHALPCIGLAVHPLPTANVVEVGQRIREVIDETVADFPVGIEVFTVADQAKVVAASVWDFTVSLAESVGIVLVVLLVGLGPRIGIIVGLQIPLVIFGAFIGMSAMGIDLHRTSLGALIISLGMLVDNSIVVSDMILGRLKEGQSRLRAATETFVQAGKPLAIGTFISILGFSPIYFSVESTGEFLGSLFVVIALTLALSWLSAFTITALNCYLFLRPPGEGGEKGAATAGPLFNRYRVFIRALLRRRKITLGALLAGLVASLLLLPLVDKTFFPLSTRAQFIAEIQSPEGSRIEVTDAMVREVEEFLLADPAVLSATSFVGTGIPRYVLTFGPTSPSPSLGQILVNTTHSAENARLQRAVREFVAEHLPDAELRLETVSLGPSDQYKIEFRISGPDHETLRSLSNRIQGIMHRVPGTREICDNWRGQIPAYFVEVDEDRARRAGVTDAQVASALKILVDGAQVDVFREGIYRLPIVVRGHTEGEEIDLQRILSTPIPSSVGPDVTVPLSQVATARLDWVDGRVWRRNRIPSIYPRCNARTDEGFTTESVRGRIAALINAEIQLPPGYRAEWGGEYESSQDSQAALFAFVPVALTMIVVLLVYQFNSGRRFVLLLLNIPFAMIGVVFGLLVLGQSFGFVALLGLLALIGMLINIGIMLVDQIELNREAGMPLSEALVEASVMRVRAIGLSAGTTVLGMLPLVISDPFWRALGVLIMFGLSVGAFLTPIVIPLLYSFFFRESQGDERPVER
ncbi:MAG: efflux RND transporter permease subunit [Candidatus Sumerlaeia bacterium]|nr:efflux RND transporter permease subunit [Candidatus Sumerlaeia bacterium]